MAEPSYLSTAQASDAFGVSVTTVKRWVDDGLLPAHKTPGGHRKLLLADVLRLAREGHFPHLDLEKLHRRRPKAGEASRSDQLLAALRAGDGAEVRAIVLGAYQAGVPSYRIADEIVAPAMSQLGHDWETGRIDVMHEHRGTQLCQSALYELEARVASQAGRERPVAVGGCPEKDHYVLPSLLAQTALIDEGWEAINLGPNTPLASLWKAVETHRPRLVWLSASYLLEPAVFLNDYRAFYQQAARLGVAVAVGGRALTEPIRREMSYTSFGDRLEQLAMLARTLNPRPRQPKRGRPPRSGT